MILPERFANLRSTLPSIQAARCGEPNIRPDCGRPLGPNGLAAQVPSGYKAAPTNHSRLEPHLLLELGQALLERAARKHTIHIGLDGVGTGAEIDAIHG